MLTILTFHQIGALSVLFTISMLIAFCPLLILRWFYKRKKRRLRRLNNNNNNNNQLNGMKNSLSPSSSISDMAIACTLQISDVVVNLLRSLNGGLLLASLFLIFIPQLRSNFDTLMNSYVYKSQYGYHHQQQQQHHGSNFNSLMHMPEPEPYILNRRNDSHVNLVFNDEFSINNDTEPTNRDKFANVNSEKKYSHLNNIFALKFSPIPIVEVILCLAFFTLYFVEEFIQLCFRYRKYFWAFNSTVVISSSDVHCNYTSLDYRINCTKRFLIDCSRKTFTTSNYSSSGSSSSTNDGRKDCERTCFDRSTPITMMSSNDNNSTNYQQNYHIDKMIMIPGFASTMTKVNPLVQNEFFTNERSNEQNGDDMNAEPIKQQQQPTQQYESLNLSNNNDGNHLVDGQNFVNHNEPQSLLSNSSAHLPSYYWQQQPEFNMIANNCSHHHQPSTLDENLHLNIFNNKSKQNHDSDHHHHNHCQHHLLPHDLSEFNHNPKANDAVEDDVKKIRLNADINTINKLKSIDFNDHDEEEKFSSEVKQKSKWISKRTMQESPNESDNRTVCCFCNCCNCCSQHYHHSNAISSTKTDKMFDDNSTTSGSMSGQTLAKIFLPDTTQLNNMPALYIGEGILIAIQPSIALLWLMLFVILMHKMANGLAMANELHYRTTGRQRNLPSSTIFMFTSLPSLGCLSVIVANILIYWKINLDFATASFSKMNQQQHHQSNHTTIALPLELVILKVILVSLSAATLLHLIMLTIQQRHHTYLLSTSSMNNTKNNSNSMVHSSSMKIDNQKSKKQSVNDGKEYRKRKFNRKQPTIKSTPSYSSNSHNSRIFQNSTPFIGPTSIITTLSRQQQTLLSMTISSTASTSESKSGIITNNNNNNNNDNMPISIDDQNVTNTSMKTMVVDHENGINNDNMPLITVHRNNVLHYFIMYSGFIVILMAIAFLNFKNFNL